MFGPSLWMDDDEDDKRCCGGGGSNICFPAPALTRRRSPGFPRRRGDGSATGALSADVGSATHGATRGYRMSSNTSR